MSTDAKRLTRVYFPGEIHAHGLCTVPPVRAHHLMHVLRLAAGDALLVFDGSGHEYDAVIERVGKSGVTLRVSDPREVDRESPLVLTLAQGISSGERMDYTVQKAVELGVTGIQPLTTERSVVRLDATRAAKRAAHWQAIIVSACEQCGRNRVPEVRPVETLPKWLGSVSDALKLVLSPGAVTTLATLPRPQSAVTLLVGPEGGLSPREQRDAASGGFLPVRLGPRVLRTETAALAALAAMQTLWGDF